MNQPVPAWYAALSILLISATTWSAIFYVQATGHTRRAAVVVVAIFLALIAGGMAA